MKLLDMENAAKREWILKKLLLYKENKSKRGIKMQSNAQGKWIWRDLDEDILYIHEEDRIFIILNIKEIKVLEKFQQNINIETGIIQVWKKEEIISAFYLKASNSKEL